MKSSNFVVKALLATLVTSCAVVPAAEASFVARLKLARKAIEGTGNPEMDEFLYRRILLPMVCAGAAVVAGAGYLGYKVLTNTPEKKAEKALAKLAKKDPAAFEAAINDARAKQVAQAQAKLDAANREAEKQRQAIEVLQKSGTKPA